MSNKDLMLIPSTEVYSMAVAVADSGLFGMKTPKEAFALMLIAQAEGMHPAIAARDYHIIEGRPTLKADAMMARFQAAGGTVKWSEMTDKRCAAVFSHPQGGEIEIDWDMDMAKRAGLGPGNHRNGSPNMWSKYPRQMLRARTLSEGIRAVFPGANAGTYTPEEAEDMEPKVIGSSSTTSQPQAKEKVETAEKTKPADTTKKADVIDVPFAEVDTPSEEKPDNADTAEAKRDMFKKVRDALEGALNGDDLDSVMDSHREDIASLPDAGQEQLKGYYENLKKRHNIAA